MVYELEFQLLMVSTLMVILIYRCCYVCERQRRPTRLYRRMSDDERPVESVIIDNTARRPQRQETPTPEWDFDTVRPPRAPRAFGGPTVHGPCRASPPDASLVAPPPYSIIVTDAPTIGGPPPTYQEVVDSQRQQNANRTSPNQSDT